MTEGAGQPINRRTVWRVAEFFRPYWRRVALTLAAILVVAVIGLLNPYLGVGLMIVLPILTALIGDGQA